MNLSGATERATNGQGLGARANFVPRADVIEDAESIRVLLDMPGVAVEDLEISLEKDLLTVEGQVKFQPPEKLKLVRQEFRVGDYRRSFTISEGIDRDAITANAKNGVVEIVLPKLAQMKPRKISVTTA